MTEAPAVGGSLPDPRLAAPSQSMDPDLAPSPTAAPSAASAADGVIPQSAPISGPLRPANEVLLEQLAPTSPVFRRRAFSSMLRVLLAGKGE